MNETIPAFHASVYHHLLGSGWLALNTRYVIGQWMKKKKAKTNLNLVMKEEKVCVLQFGRCMFLFQELSAHFFNSQLRIDEIEWLSFPFAKSDDLNTSFHELAKDKVSFIQFKSIILRVLFRYKYYQIWFLRSFISLP